MGNSLQEQLLKAGLVSPEQLRDATQPPRVNQTKAADRKRGDKRRKRSPRPTGGEQRSAPKPTAGPPGAGGPVAAPQPTLEQLNTQIRKLLDDNRQNVEDAEVPYNFMRENRIKKLYVTDEQRRQLLGGELAIAGYRRIHHVIPTLVAEEILALRSEIFVHRATIDSPTPSANVANPERASGPESTLPSSSADVPDDLV